MNWKNVLESVSESVNDDLRLRHEYLPAENRLMRQPIDERPPGAPATGKAVFLSTIHHRPIRDGPIPRRPRFDGLRKDDGRQAAYAL